MKTKRTRTVKNLVRRRPKVDCNAMVPLPAVKRRMRDQLQHYSDVRSDSPVSVYLATLGSDRSRYNVLESLRRVIRLLDQKYHKCRDKRTGELIDVIAFPWHMIRYRHMVDIRSTLGEKCAPSTANHTITCVRGVLRVAWNQGIISTDDYQRASGVKGIRGSRIKKGRHVAKSEVVRMAEICRPNTITGVRDVAILLTMYGCGFRRNEIASIDISDVDMGRRKVKVIGKGNKEREVPMPDFTFKALRVWLKVRGKKAGTLFLPCSTKRVFHRPINAETIRKVVERVAARAEINMPTSPHDFRRSYIGELFDANVDIATIQGLVGHASPVTTSRYDRRGEEAQAKAVRKLKIEFTPPELRNNEDGLEDV
jgi:site-specific recombinase XerC